MLSKSNLDELRSMMDTEGVEAALFVKRVGGNIIRLVALHHQGNDDHFFLHENRACSNVTWMDFLDSFGISKCIASAHKINTIDELNRLTQ